MSKISVKFGRLKRNSKNQFCNRFFSIDVNRFEKRDGTKRKNASSFVKVFLRFVRRVSIFPFLVCFVSFSISLFLFASIEDDSSCSSRKIHLGKLVHDRNEENFSSPRIL